MDARNRIRQVGFRKWYERELLQGHAYLVLVILCAVGLLGSLEVFGTREGLAAQLTVLACAVASAAIGYWALRRYLYLLGHAQHVADQAACPACHVYARWDIDEPRGPRGEQDPLRVRCRACGDVWHISL